MSEHTYNWRAAEAHNRALDEVYAIMGNEKGKIVRFSSKIFWPEMDKRGHSDSDFYRCRCRHGETT